ncbi:MAG: hypothetical protein CM15mP22_2900 [Gammaproteobacteria bacterium]|nr:MAG: hypothetical protein CM15mP22_2900 [Gammaproteobacteria bacterium]
MPKVLTQIAFFSSALAKEFLDQFSLLASTYCVCFYMEYQLGLEPCPMCIVQRIAIALVA